VNEKINVKDADAKIFGQRSGNHRFLNLLNLLFPNGNKNADSSYDESIVERMGSHNLTTNAKLNQA
jgi:hypothetical protein